MWHAFRAMRRRGGAAAGGPLRAAAGPQPKDDGWIGTPEWPGYRAGRIVAKLADLPGVDDRHPYLDLLLLGDAGRTEDTLAGPCLALARDGAIDERSRYVRTVAELMRHAADPALGLAGLQTAFDFIREHGLEGERLAAAAQQLDAACTERALVACLGATLELCLGTDEAHEAMRRLLQRVARGRALDDAAWRARDGELPEQIAVVVRLLGKAQARRALREATDFDLLPTPELLGL